MTVITRATDDQWDALIALDLLMGGQDPWTPIGEALGIEPPAFLTQRLLTRSEAYTSIVAMEARLLVVLAERVAARSRPVAMAKD